MTEEEWQACKDPHAMLESRPAMETDRKLRLFAVACCRRTMPFLTDLKGVEGRLEIAERYADGLATAQELRTAQYMAMCAGGPSFDHFGHEAARDVAPWAAVSARLVCESAVMLSVMKLPPKRSESAALFSRIRRLFTRSRRQAPFNRTTEVPPEYLSELLAQCELLRDIFGNPFRPDSFNSSWLTSTVTTLAHQMYESRDFSGIPILADALQDAGCEDHKILNHCREAGEHVRGCWVVDSILGKS
jgi:hypothetical protein